MVQSKAFDDPECILCANCVDNCPKRNLKFSWLWGEASPPRKLSMATVRHEEKNSVNI